MTRTWNWLGVPILVVGCRYVVSFDGFSGVVEQPGTAAAGNGGSSGGLGGSTGGSGTANGGGGAEPDAGSMSDGPSDGPVDTPPLSGPTLVYTAPADATMRGITVSGPNLYWVEGGLGRGLFRMNKNSLAGDAFQIHATPSAYDIAVDATNIYWSDAATYKVWQVPIAGGQISEVFSHNSMFPRYITVDDQGIVYVTTETDILSGGMGSSANPYAQQSLVAGIAFDPEVDAGTRRLRWGYARGIKEGPAQGSMTAMDVQDLYTGLSGAPVQGVATDGPHVFWISDSKSIRKGEPAIGSAGDSGCVSPPQDLGPYADIAVDADWIYFTWPNRNQIWKCSR